LATVDSEPTVRQNIRVVGELGKGEYTSCRQEAESGDNPGQDVTSKDMFTVTHFFQVDLLGASQSNQADNRD
jgi:hypothetical protein